MTTRIEEHAAASVAAANERSPDDPFGRFERDGWEQPDVCATYHEGFCEVTPLAIAPLLDAVCNGTQRTLLDVATGPGYAAAFARELGMTAIGLDFSVAQIRLARSIHPGVDYIHGDALDLPFEDDRFDAVICNMGLMHFSNPDKAIAEAFRVLKPGGRYAFSSFDTPDKTVGFGLFYDAVNRHGTMDVGLPDGPNYFRFSDPATCIASLQRAGFTRVELRRTNVTWRLRSPESLMSFIERGTVRASATLAAQTPQAREAIKTSVSEAVRARRSNGGTYDIPMPLVISSGRKP